MAAVVVAMAGMILPAICFTFSLSTSGIEYIRALKLEVEAMKSMWKLVSSS
jgi:hypothetical protein